MQRGNSSARWWWGLLLITIAPLAVGAVFLLKSGIHKIDPARWQRGQTVVDVTGKAVSLPPLAAQKTASLSAQLTRWIYALGVSHTLQEFMEESDAVVFLAEKDFHHPPGGKHRTTLYFDLTQRLQGYHAYYILGKVFAREKEAEQIVRHSEQQRRAIGRRLYGAPYRSVALPVPLSPFLAEMLREAKGRLALPHERPDWVCDLPEEFYRPHPHWGEALRQWARCLHPERMTGEI